MSDQLTPDQFAVGEIAIINNPVSINHGKEVTIIGPLQLIHARNTRTGVISTEPRYPIDAPNLEHGPHYDPGGGNWAEPRYLRKKRPPREDLEVVRWADCPWQPESLHV